jgi:hypothetical protein
MPGNYLAAILVEHFLWGSALPVWQISLLEIALSILINGTIWLLLAFGLRTVTRAWKRRLAALKIA